MIAIEYIIGFAMALTNLFKKKLPTAAIPFVSFGLSILLNIINAALFGGKIPNAAKDAFCSAGIVIGIFNVGSIASKLVPANTTTGSSDTDANNDKKSSN